MALSYALCSLEDIWKISLSVMFDEPKYCYGFSPRNLRVLTQLLNVHYIFKDINHKVPLLLDLYKIADLTTRVVLG